MKYGEYVVIIYQLLKNGEKIS